MKYLSTLVFIFVAALVVAGCNQQVQPEETGVMIEDTTGEEVLFEDVTESLDDEAAMDAARDAAAEESNEVMVNDAEDAMVKEEVVE